jgi:hypothetical protein
MVVKGYLLMAKAGFLRRVTARCGKPVRDAKLVVHAGPNTAVDGLAMDIEGSVYIAANGAGQLWRYDRCQRGDAAAGQRYVRYRQRQPGIW